jgi:molybdate transport system substrate-binding protein
MKKGNGWIKLVWVLCFSSLLAACTASESAPPRNVTLLVSAASSMRQALEEIGKRYEQTHGVTLQYQFGSSGSLQKQIEQGAPVDLFISADTKQMDALEQQGLIDPATRTNIVRNELVLLVPKSNPSGITRLEDLNKARLIAIGDPRTVPVGTYAQAWLKWAGIWGDLQPSQFSLGKDAGQVLAYVEQEAVDAAIVYRSDARRAKGVKEVATAPEELNRMILYPAAVIKTSPFRQEARAFLEYLLSGEAQKVFSSVGFIAVNERG